MKQREIKFRGRKIDSGEWVYGCLVNNLWKYSENSPQHGQNVCEIITSGECDDYEGMQGDGLNATVYPGSVGQFTGLRDKNGKEIYEGDIVKDGSHVSRVGWNVKFASFVLDSIDWVFSHYFEEAVKPEDCEVIGNIYQNPELIKKEATHES